MAITTIFPHFPTDVGEGILYYLKQCPRALVDLSGTHWVAYNKLGNGTYFQQLFAEQDPLLAKMDRVFCQLKLDYPKCCWKVACCALLEGYKPFTMEFLERSISYLHSSKPAAKEKEDPVAMNKLGQQLIDLRELNRLCLLVDLYFAKNAEGFMCDLKQLEQLKNAFHVMDEKLSESAYCAACFSHCVHINLVLEILYHQCANRVDEECWAEKHFHEFPQEYADIVARLITSAKSFRKICLENLHLCLRRYVGRNIEDLRGKLTSLEAVQNTCKEIIAIDDPTRRGALISEVNDKMKRIDPFLFEISTLPIYPNTAVLAKDVDKLTNFLSLLIERIKHHWKPST